VRRVIVGWLSNGTLEASVAASSEKSGTFPSRDKKRKHQAVLEAPHDSSAVAKSLYYQLLGLLLSGIDAGALSVRVRDDFELVEGMNSGAECCCQLLCLRSLLECVKSSRLVGSGQFDAELLTRIVTKMVKPTQFVIVSITCLSIRWFVRLWPHMVLMPSWWTLSWKNSQMNMTTYDFTWYVLQLVLR
jgi:hypothetical protein